MFNRTNLLVFVVAIVGAALGLLVGQRFDKPAERIAPPGVTVSKIGEMRPDLQLADVGGKPRRLSEWNGRVVLINFWATWCGPCREEMPLLDRARGKHGVEVIGVAVDEPAAVAEFLKDSPVGYPVLLAADDGKAELTFGDTRGVLPFSVLVGKDGKLLARREGSFSPEMLKSWLADNLPLAD
jgi:thiol-disulfide isomerase/thioredoxin